MHILEDMRERYIYDTYYGKDERGVWWDYMTEIHKRCYNSITVECSRNVMEDLGIDYEMSKLYAMNTFTNFGDALKNSEFTVKHSFEDFIKSIVTCNIFEYFSIQRIYTYVNTI